jgi:hypothetical protein
MSPTDDAAADPADQPPWAAAFTGLKPYIATVALVELVGGPAEFLVPVARRLRGEMGVSLGPGLVNLGSGLLALGVVRFFRRCPGLWEEKRPRIPAWSGPAALGCLTLAPAAAAGWKRGVVLRRRSALWGAVIHPVGLLQITLLLDGLSRARASATPPSPRSGAAS